MSGVNQARASGLLILVATVLLPLAGAWTFHRDVTAVFTFPPPLAIPTAYPQFSWIACVLVLAPFVGIACAWLSSRRRAAARSHSRSPDECPPPRAERRFPLWGSIAAAWVLAWWILAWTRFSWFEPFQRYTFFPLWLGFIVFVNAMTQWRHGDCLMRRTPAKWLRLFAASAIFWWLFEWLNRFARNWHYLATADFGPVAYAVHATFCFSTVLPAVTAVAEFLVDSSAWQKACASGPRFQWLTRRTAAVLLAAGGAVGLFGTGPLPQYFYPALWAAPLALLIADSILFDRGESPERVARGDWGGVASWTVAALICGFFWELWNFHSAAKWIYTVPFVDRWHVFEMPLLGYAGYLPFGLECYFVAVRTLGGDPLFSSASST